MCLVDSSITVCLVDSSIKFGIRVASQPLQLSYLSVSVSYDLPCSSFHLKDHCRILDFVYHITGKALKNHLIRNISTPNCELCQIECFTERRCLSYNCRGVSCELNSADHIEYPEDLKDEEGSDYHAAEVSGYSGGECSEYKNTPNRDDYVLLKKTLTPIHKND